MSRHPLIRWTVHLLLILALVLPGTAAPAQAVADALSALATQDAEMPCDGMQTAPEHRAGMPCDCCEHGKCDISACLGTGCLFAPPRLVAAIPLTNAPQPWRRPAPPSHTIETPLRPPIV